jgi:hypothetical protein
VATGRAAPIDATRVDLATARAIEATEVGAWSDLYSAAPEHFAEAAGLGFTVIGGSLLLRWAATGRRYFNRTIGLGVIEPATPETLDRILEHYEQAGITMFLLQSLPHCQPAEYRGWLLDRGLEPLDAQDRVVRGGEPLAAPVSSELVVERVARESSAEWSEFLQHVYRLDTGPWLPKLIGRPGWHQYAARREDEIVAARGMYIGPDGAAWLGMDGPVPGVMTDDYEPDAALCAFIVQDGLARGATAFVADIEAPSDVMDTPAYEYFGRLGFRRPYVRTHYARR